VLHNDIERDFFLQAVKIAKQVLVNEKGRHDLSENSVDLMYHAMLIYDKFTFDPVKKAALLKPRKHEITCAICMKSFRSLKRHLHETHATTEAEYKFYFQIPSKTKLIATSLHVKRSSLAKESGSFGHEVFEEAI